MEGMGVGPEMMYLTETAATQRDGVAWPGAISEMRKVKWGLDISARVVMGGVSSCREGSTEILSLQDFAPEQSNDTRRETRNTECCGAQVGSEA